MDYSKEKQNLYAAIALGADAVVKYFDNLLIAGSSKEELTEFAFQVLESATEATQYTAIYRAGFIIEDWAKVETLDRLINVRKKLPALPGLRDYRVDFDLYIDLLKNLKQGKCKCSVYSNYNTPPGHKLFFSESTIEVNYMTETTVRCSLCNQRYKVEVNYDYHYPIAKWERI